MPSALRLDHIVIGVPDVDEAERELSLVLGRRPSWRGRHPTYGTTNVLYRLDNAYIELLAPDADAAAGTAWTGYLGSFLEMHGSGLFAVAFTTDDVATQAAELRARGIPIEEPASGEGVDLMTGAVRHWVNARIPVAATRGAPSFVIEHRSPPDALPMAPLSAEPTAAASGVLAVVIESAEADAARAFYRESFGLAESPSGEGWRYDLGDTSLLVWSGVGEAQATDRWRRLLLRTASLPALFDRLDGARVDIEQGDFREGYGIRLEACGAELIFLESLG